MYLLYERFQYHLSNVFYVCVLYVYLFNFNYTQQIIFNENVYQTRIDNRAKRTIPF